MSSENYFGNRKTGGSNSSKGFFYQDLCAAVYLLRNLKTVSFNAIGIETDDDFSLIFDDKKINVQVKNTELSIGKIKKYICENQVIIGTSKNKSLSTFLRFLNQYRNSQSSCENNFSKMSVTEDFKSVLGRNDIALDKIKEIPDSWSVEIISEDNIQDIIRSNIVEWGLENSLLLDGDKCLKDLLFTINKCRCERGYIGIADIKDIFAKYSERLILKQGAQRALNFLEKIDLEHSEILNSVNSKVSHAESLLIDRKYEESLREYIELSKTVKSEKVYLKCSGILQLLDKIDDAILYTDYALKVAPLYPTALAVKGTLLAEKGDYDFALEFLKGAEF